MRTAAPLLMLVLTCACAGSASESPWPPEPADVDLGPAGEREVEALRTAKAAEKKPVVRESPSPVNSAERVHPTAP